MSPNMSEHSDAAFTLRCSDDEGGQPVLAGVHAEARLDGVLSALTLRQTYRNAGSDNLELIYTFPLPFGAVLLGFAAELGGRRLQGTVQPRALGEQQYEKALAEGDAPALLEVSAGGLHTANIGNLRPGESIVLEVRFAQLLAFEQGRLRLAIPTTIAPRYGNAQRGGLQPQQVPEVSLSAEHPLTLALTVCGPLASGRVECATHAHSAAKVDGGLRIELAPGARLDRDVVFLLTPAEPLPDLLVLADDPHTAAAPRVALAAFELPRRPDRSGIALRLLVDCSGSMAGDSMASAQAALHGVVAALTTDDEVSLSRFGSQVEHVLGPARCGARQAQQLHTNIDDTSASLGGTEMRLALHTVFAAWPREQPVDVLMVTDGEVWEAEDLVETARRSGCRVFAIGVGSAPAEGLLRQIAEATGGACEFATPGESLQQAAARMLRRIRQLPWSGLRVDWGTRTHPAWQAGLTSPAFGGDTLLAFAGFGKPQEPAGPVRLMGTGADGREVELARTRAGAPCPGDDLARIAAFRRLGSLDAAAALQLALDHQLLTGQTNCVLVHSREQQDKPLQAPRLQRVQPMLAAGWAGIGATAFSAEPLPNPMSQAMHASSLRRRAPPVAAARQVDPIPAYGDIASAAEFDPVDANPAFHRTVAEDDLAAHLAGPELRDILMLVLGHLSAGDPIDTLSARCRAMTIVDPLREAMDELDAMSIDPATGWLLLAQWVAGREGQRRDELVAAMLAAATSGVDTQVRQQAMMVFERLLGDGGPSERSRRLAQAMSG